MSIYRDSWSKLVGYNSHIDKVWVQLRGPASMDKVEIIDEEPCYQLQDDTHKREHTCTHTHTCMWTCTH